jgi:hypothetical protein
MLDKEVLCIARHMDAQGLKEWGEVGRQKSLAERQRRASERAEEIKAYKAARPKAMIREIAVFFGCSIGLVSKCLNRQEDVRHL